MIYGPDYTRGRMEVQTGRRAMHHAMTGAPIQAGYKVWGTCGTPLCVRHSHSQCGTPQDFGAWLIETQAYKGNTSRRIALRMTGLSRRILRGSDHTEAMASTEPLGDLAARLGVSKTTAWRYRSGRRGVPSGMFTGLMGAAS